MKQAIQTLAELAAAEGLCAMSAKHAGDAGLKAAVHGMQAASLRYAARRLEEIAVQQVNTERVAAAKLVPLREVTKQEALTDTQRLDWLGLRPREFVCEREEGEGGWGVGQMEGSRSDLEFRWLTNPEHLTIRDAIDAAMLNDGALKDAG